MSKKTKIAEMKRLRATEMTLANAARLSQDRRGPGRAFAAADGLAMVLIGGIVALGFEMTRTWLCCTNRPEGELPLSQTDSAYRLRYR
jgi:hypothetical protein